MRCNGHRSVVPVEPLSARALRLRIAIGYSVYELATAAGISAGTIQRLESGKPVDKRVLPALASTLGVPLCQLVSAASAKCGPAPVRGRASRMPKPRR
jgi:transcriptional regulator with XRE-family HTH domain